MYHNSTEQTGETLREYRAKAGSQEDKVLRHIRRQPYGTGFTGSYLWKHVFQMRCPITSPRRVLSDLTAAEVLVKTTEQRDGEYGRPECVYKLANPVQLELV